MMDHRISSLSKIFAIGLVAGIPACGGSRQPANAPNSEAYGSAMNQPPLTEPGAAETSHSETSTYAPGSAPGATGSTSESPPPGGPNEATGTASPMGVDTSGFGDSQIAAVLRAIHQSEIQAAQLAQAKAFSDDVKRFARDAIAAHSERLRGEDSLFSRLQLTPNDNVVSNQLSIESQNQLAAFRTAHGPKFGRDYIDAEIRSHQRALELIDRMLLQAQDSGLKVELGDTRKIIEHELASAQNLQLTLNRPPSDMSESTRP